MKTVFENLGTKCKAYFRQSPDGYITIIINTQLSWIEQQRAYLHELAHIRENDLFSELSASEIEKIRHSFPASLQECAHTKERSNGVIGFYRKSQEEIEYEREQEWNVFSKFLGERIAK